MTGRRVHYMDTTHMLCGTDAAQQGDEPAYTDDRREVTCRRCQAILAKRAPSSDLFARAFAAEVARRAARAAGK